MPPRRGILPLPFIDKFVPGHFLPVVSCFSGLEKTLNLRSNTPTQIPPPIPFFASPFFKQKTRVFFLASRLLLAQFLRGTPSSKAEILYALSSFPPPPPPLNGCCLFVSFRSPSVLPLNPTPFRDFPLLRLSRLSSATFIRSRTLFAPSSYFAFRTLSYCFVRARFYPWFELMFAPFCNTSTESVQFSYLRSDEDRKSDPS